MSLRVTLAILVFPSILGAQNAAPGAPIPAHDTFTVASRVLGEARRINVHTPAGYDGARARYPVLYMPDGGIDEDFPHVVQTVDSLLAAGSIRPVIVVGIPNTQRRRDLTGPTRFKTDSAIAPRVGGSAAFREFLRDELLPAIQARYRTTDERSIVGESLAGLFIVETFLLEPRLFRHYVALDPSVWWNGNVLVDSASAYLTRIDSSPKTIVLSSSNVPEITTGTARIAELLRASIGKGITAVYTPRPDLTHATIYRAAGPAALARALR